MYLVTLVLGGIVGMFLGWCAAEISTTKLISHANKRIPIRIRERRYCIITEEEYVRSGAFEFSPIVEHVIKILAPVKEVKKIYFKQSKGRYTEFVVATDRGATTSDDFTAATAEVERSMGAVCSTLGDIAENQVRVYYSDTRFTDLNSLSRHSVVYSKGYY